MFLDHVILWIMAIGILMGAGDHLGFTAGVRPEMIAAVVIGKLLAGVLALVRCIWMSKDLSKEIARSETASFIVTEAKA
jgi:ethanolamine transporter EutH